MLRFLNTQFFVILTHALRALVYAHHFSLSSFHTRINYIYILVIVLVLYISCVLICMHSERPVFFHCWAPRFGLVYVNQKNNAIFCFLPNLSNCPIGPNCVLLSNDVNDFFGWKKKLNAFNLMNCQRCFSCLFFLF